MSASEAARNFSAVLDSAEHGETIVVTRSGRRVALIAPAPRANGGAVLDLFDDSVSSPASTPASSIREVQTSRSFRSFATWPVARTL